jgi:GT2 family glycosyltransferase
MSGDRPRVYAIIVNYKGWGDTIECLESLMRSDYPNLRTIVCDNGSTDPSLDRIRGWASGAIAAASTPNVGSTEPPSIPKPVSLRSYGRAEFESLDTLPDDARVHLVACGTNLGFAGANNVGLRLVQRQRAAFALLLNNDAIIAPTAISRMVAAARASDGIGAVGATILEYQNPDRVEMLGGARLSRVHGMTTAAHAGLSRDAARPAAPGFDFITGCCVLLPRQTLDAVGLMDERYFLYGEDADWCLRIASAGLRLTYSADAEVWHKGGASVVHASALHDYYDVRGRLMLIHKHFPWMVPLAFLHSTVFCVLPKLARGEWGRFGATVRGCRDFLAHAFGRTMTPRSV